jgi:hypothetical protein
VKLVPAFLFVIAIGPEGVDVPHDTVGLRLVPIVSSWVTMIPLVAPTAVVLIVIVGLVPAGTAKNPLTAFPQANGEVPETEQKAELYPSVYNPALVAVNMVFVHCEGA